MTLTYVVTSYNNLKYLNDCLNSIQGQTRRPEEIIVIDDCSTDGSVSFLNAYAANHPQVKLLLNERNLGAGATRHRGFMAASCTFVTNLAGDDTIYPHKVENELDLLENHGADVAFSDFALFNPFTGEETLMKTGYFADLEDPKARVAALCSRTNPLPHHMIYRKSIYVDTGGFDTTAGMYEDWAFKLKLGRMVLCWMHTGKRGLRYNRHGTGLSSSEGIIHTYWRLYVIARHYESVIKPLGPEGLASAMREAFSPLNSRLSTLDAPEAIRERARIAIERLYETNGFTRYILESVRHFEKTATSVKVPEHEARQHVLATIEAIEAALP